MANRFSVNPLGGFDVGSAIAGLGDQYRQSQIMEQEQAEQDEFQGVLKEAYLTGDQNKIAEVFSVNPNIGEFLSQREAEKAEKLGIEQLAASKKAETDWGLRWKQADDEGKELLKKEALANPLIDIDDDDLPIVGQQADLAVDAMLFGHLGKDGFKQLISEDPQSTATQKDFTTYQELKKTDPGSAETFGKAAGFVEDDKKRLFKIQDGTKFFADGSEEPVGPKDKLKTPDMRRPMNEEQALKIVDKAKEGQLKNAGFAITMNDGVNKVRQMVSDGYDPKSAAWVNKYLAGTTLGNIAMTPEDQIFVGAVEQMINAIARRETGAAITAFEKEDFFNRYMPVAGDSSARIKQKRDALERQFKSIRGQAGSVYEAIRVTQGFDKKEQQAEPEIQRTDEEILAEYGL